MIDHHRLDPELLDRITLAWEAYPEIRPSTIAPLLRADISPDDIPTIPDTVLRRMRNIGPDRLAELRRHFPRATP